MRSRRLVAWLVALAVAAPAGPAHAQLYRWLNEQGEVHFTQGLENVPERFRAGARLLGYPEASPAPAPAGPAATGPASTPAVRGGARIPFTPGQPILLAVKVNGLRTVRLLLDTGRRARSSTLAPWRPSAWIRAAAAPSPSWGSPARRRGATSGLESLEVGEARVAPLGVIAYDLLLREGDGLLGRDFLDQFNLTVDSEARVVILAPR